MSLIPAAQVGVLIFLLAVASAVRADDRLEYNARVAARLESLFQTLDRNADGVLTPEESKGDLDLGPRFNDIDINRDGTMTRQELRAYIERRYGKGPAP